MERIDRFLHRIARFFLAKTKKEETISGGSAGTRGYLIYKLEKLLLLRSGFGPTYIKIGTIQRRLAWPLRKDDTQNREAFQTFAIFR